MSSPWSDNIFTTLVGKVSSKKKKAVATSDKPSSLKIQDQQFAVNGGMVAAGAQHQVQQQQQHQQFLPYQRTPVAVSTSIAISSSSSQAGRSCPNSRAEAYIPQSGSSFAGPGISRSGSAISLSILPRLGSLVLRGEASRLGASSSDTLPKMTSSLIQSAEDHRPTALRFNKADESDSNNNDDSYHGTVVADSLPLGGDEFESHLDNNNNDSSDLDESHENNNHHDYKETQLPLGFVQDPDPVHQLNQQDQQPSSATPNEWEDVPPGAIMATVKKLKPDFLEAKGLRPFYKSYISWEKLTADQRDKAAAWF
jgi:hypothetical protein